MQKPQTSYKGLTRCSECESCNEIHSQLQTSGKVSTLLAFCINSFLEIVYQSHIMTVLCKLGFAYFLPMRDWWHVLHKSFP